MLGLFRWRRHSTFFVTSLALMFVSLALASCSDPCDPLTSPSCGTDSDPIGITVLRVTTSTTGEDFDLGGYVITIDQEQWTTGWNVPRDFSRWDPGNYTVELGDVADNCSVVGSATQQVTVTEGDTTEVTFSVACTALPPATIDVTGTWIGQASNISTEPSFTVATITYELQQTGDSVTASMEWDGIQGSFPSVGVGRVSDTTFVLFSIIPRGTNPFRVTNIFAVSGTQMDGGLTEQFGLLSATLTLTKQ